jgi:ubiquinone/menaquinone biosynthesis C-methylase UbiE
VTSTDASAQDIELLREGSVDRWHGTSIQYELARAEQVPFADASFDIATCVSLLHHLASGADRVALWEMARVLKPGGMLIATVRTAPPDLQSSEVLALLEQRRFGAPYDLTSLRQLLADVESYFELAPSDGTSLGQLRIDQSDEQTHPTRIGLLLIRRERTLRPSPAAMVSALLEAQVTVEQQAA